ncbi:MAG: 16S rRNA (adenine(1518)-N(6)/adenine(1519)-N(6))-dimethyltransferase RsmA [bacterium]|nr:16S rRNA (adenine(1518)-N(6)/adenine(1519)-N(6))-dimethyltransferase RsmA [bacterium]
MLHNVIPNKLLGQHFLVSSSVLKKIIDAAELQPDDIIVEAGPGLGILTEELARRIKKVIAVEKDRTLAEILAGRLRKKNITNVEIIRDDILKYAPPPHYKIVANLPYYLTSRFFKTFLEERAVKPMAIIVMIQKEVAERIIAKPPRMNLLALGVQTFGTPRIIAKVPRGAFSPPPKVESAILKITDISDKFFKKNSVSPKQFFTLARKAFGNKRKTLKHTLKINEEELKNLGLPKTARPQELSPEQWAKLSKSLTK